VIHGELSAPPELAPGALRIFALGGLGEIGRNMTVFEFGGRLLIVDCGVLFPEETQPGIDLILPDFGPIRDRLDDVEAIVLTHGHEDHIGAVPYLLRLRADIPLLGSRLTLAFLEAKLKEHRIKARSLDVAAGQVERLGPFSVEFLAVNHSIPDAMAVAITKAHWRMRDQSPMLITSLKAPMVQKWVRCAMAPNATESAKQIHSTD
jgi:ribonuclease J